MNIHTFECVAWEQDGPDFVKPIPGTWTLLPYESARKSRCKGVLACPRCNTPWLIHDRLGTIKTPPISGNAMLVMDPFRCSCKLICTAHIKDWNLRKLYCVAYEILRSKEPIGETEYLHAETRERALFLFNQGHITDPIVRIVDCGEVIGYFATDKKEKRLVV
jgi:hypothetical protein